MNRFTVLSGKFCALLLTALLLASPLNAQVKLNEALDFDGDGKVDPSVFRAENDTFYIYGSRDGWLSLSWGDSDTDWLTPGDFDGDHKGDIAIWRETTGVFWVLRTSNFTVEATAWGLPEDIPVQRDYDGDGKTDIAIARQSGGVTVFWIFRSMTAEPLAIQWGFDTDILAPGDYDGDGKFDPAVFRPDATGEGYAVTYIFGSKDGFMTRAWGVGTDFVVPGDYDGDSKTDVAVVREGATGDDVMTWYILRSSDLGLTAVPWGITAGDIFAQGDYDGDGKTDVAVWRPDTGVYHILGSRDGYMSYQWGISSDEPLAGYDQH